MSEADREALVPLGNQPAWCECADSYCPIRSRITRAVEQIVARHVTAALNEAADAIDGESKRHMFAAANKMRPFNERDQHYGAQVASERAADIVRAATPKPPEVVRRPQPRDSGE